jgi:hypothetical protein
MAQLKKRGILARVHEASYRFLFFRLLSAKMGTKIVRVATFSIYNPQLGQAETKKVIYRHPPLPL